MANVAVKNNKLVAFGQSFVDTSSGVFLLCLLTDTLLTTSDNLTADKIADSKPSIEVSAIIHKVEKQLQGKINEIAPSLEYLIQDDGSVALVHTFQVENTEAATWYEAFVNAHSGELLSVNDFRWDAAVSIVSNPRST